MKLALFIVAALVTSATAQPKDAGETAYQEGRRYYDLRDWDKAIEKFKEAYKLRSDGPSLFNIAQSYRLKGDCVEALGFYKTYKRNFPTAQNIAAVDKFITELEPCAQQAKTAKPVESSGSTTTPPPVTHQGPAPGPGDLGAGRKATGLIVGGAGVLIAGTGFVFGALAQGKANQISNADPDMPMMWDPSIEESGKRFDLLAKIAWGVGGAAVIGGVVLYVMGMNTEGAQVTAMPTRDGAIVGFTTTF